MGNLYAALNQGLGCVRTSAIVSFPRAEPGVSLGQRQSHGSPDSREVYPWGFEEVTACTEQYSEPGWTSAASGTRKLRPLQDGWGGCSQRRPGSSLSWAAGAPAEGGGRVLTSLTSSARLPWTHRLQDNIKHAVETGLESAAAPPLEAVEQLAELEKKNSFWTARGCGQQRWRVVPKPGGAKIPLLVVLPWDLQSLISGHEC